MMIKLASNATALLFKCGREYWAVHETTPRKWCPDGWEYSCVNIQSETYKAVDALAFFDDHYGPHTWVRNDIAQF